ncbi:MAG TPA: FtsW/RodA/SpoVE family cell cycle protein [Kiritimatiellia bacterium]|nr:FtsW/RodA/SpoVE family cell cycle protein [Kiritimatiellia bacterium]
MKNLDGSERIGLDVLASPERLALGIGVVGLIALGLFLVAGSTPERLPVHVGWLLAGGVGAALAARGGFDARPGMLTLLAAPLAAGLVYGFIHPSLIRPWNAAVLPALSALIGVLWLSARAVPLGRAAYGALLVAAVGALGIQRNIAALVATGLTGLILLRCAGVRRSALLLGLCFMSSALLVVWMQDPVFLRRMAPAVHTDVGGTHARPLTVQAMRAGGWTGSDPSESLLLRYARQDSTRAFAGARMVEKWGGGALLIAGLAYGVIAGAAWRIHRSTQHPADRLTAVAAPSLLVIPAVWHLVGITQALPFRGIALPLVSHDGPMLVISLVAVGWLFVVRRGAHTPC